jgi:sulfate permease, SulP family
MSGALPEWLRSYRREWLPADIVAGIVVWSVVVPQAVAYAQIAGLPPEAGLIAAPGALLAYALLGTSRTVIVSATTATSALSASAVGPLADGDPERFAALSVAFALVVAAVLGIAGLLRLGSIADLISKPVTTGFLFGLGLTIAVGQLPKVLGIDEGDGTFFERAVKLLGDLGEVQGWTAAVGIASIVALVALKRLAPGLPGILIVLVAGIVVSALLGLDDRGVDVVGELPQALPDPGLPDVSVDDLVALLPAALGVIVLSTEAVGVARALATKDGYSVSPSRELFALGGSNLLAGLSQGFVQSGGASQTAAAENAGGRTQLTSIVAAGLVLLTGAFLTGLFRDLPQATLGAIVVVAVAGFWDVGELVRFARLRRSAIALAIVALIGVLAVGVLPGLVVAALLSLVIVVQRLSRPPIGFLARDPASGAWARLDHHPNWETVPGVLVVHPGGPLFYANAGTFKDRVLSAVRAADPRPGVVVIDLSTGTDLDVEALDTLDEIATALAKDGGELRLAGARRKTMGMLERGGLAERVRIEPTLDAATDVSPPRTPSTTNP